MNRRTFLQNSSLLGGGLFLSPQVSLAQSILRNLMVSSQAQAADLYSPRFYMNILLKSAPFRNHFDHWYRTNSDDPAMYFNPLHGTAFQYNATSREITGTEYRTLAAANGTLVPYLFGTFSESERNSFLDNFLVLRGYGTGQDGHVFNAAMQLHPLASAPSASGFLADHSGRNFKAVGYPGSPRYQSKNSVGMNRVTGSNPLSELLGTVGSASSTRTLRLANQDIISAVRHELNQLDPNNKAVRIAKGSLDSTYQLLNSTLGDYASAWDPLVAEYKNIMETAARSMSIPGLNTTLDGTASLAGTSNATASYNYGSLAGTISIASGRNLMDITSNLDFTSLARNLALADYCISNDLISSLEGGSPSIQGVRKDPGQPFSSANSVEVDNDMHVMGDYVATYLMSMFYRGFTAGLMHFKQKMVAAGRWQDTILHVTSDFGRSLRSHGVGSDHAFNGMVSSVFSGVFSGGPYVVGNIQRGVALNPSLSYSGTQGEAALIPGFSNNIPTPVTVISSISRLMGISENPWNNLSAPLISLTSDGKLSYNYGKGRMIG